jgi:hypothetical protein
MGSANFIAQIIGLLFSIDAVAACIFLGGIIANLT